MTMTCENRQCREKEQDEVDVHFGLVVLLRFQQAMDNDAL